MNLMFITLTQKAIYIQKHAEHYHGRKHPRIKGVFLYGPGRLERAGAVY